MSDRENTDFGKPQDFDDFNATSDDDVEAHLFNKPQDFNDFSDKSD